VSVRGFIIILLIIYNNMNKNAKRDNINNTCKKHISVFELLASADRIKTFLLFPLQSKQLLIILVDLIVKLDESPS